MSIGCYGGNNGSIQANAGGGAGPYTYAWSNNGEGSMITSLSAGAYTVTVTDNNGLTASKTVEMLQPSLLGVTLNGQPQLCDVAPDGYTYAIATGGTPPFIYNWSNGVLTQLNNHLNANVYHVTITDTRGCTTTGSYTVGYLGIGLYLFGDSEPAKCPTPDNGSAKVSVASGTAPYQYQWAGGASAYQIQHLTPGSYTVTVTDANGCHANTNVLVERLDADPTLVDVLLPQCKNQLYEFESAGEYRIYNWTLSDPRDSIVEGEGSNHIKVKWGAVGQKEITVSMSDSTTECATGSLYKVNVYECSVSAQEPLMEGFEAMPNPFDNQLVIRNLLSGNQEHFAAAMYDAQGRLVAGQEWNGREFIWDTGSVLPGVYMLHLTDGKQLKTIKLVK